MSIDKTKQLMAKNWGYYLIGSLIILGLKYWGSSADGYGLRWLLAPTAWWASALIKIPFHYVPGSGYVNHDYRFIIAPSCSGLQFMAIAIATLLYSFVHRMEAIKKGGLWLGMSLVVSYLYTIFINGLRIMLAIYVPIYLQTWRIGDGFLGPGQLHTCIGVVVYFTALLILCHIGGRISQTLANARYAPKDTPLSIIGTLIPPVFWYLFIALGIPFLNRAPAKNSRQFTEYAVLITAICAGILSCLGAGIVVYKQARKWK